MEYIAHGEVLGQGRENPVWEVRCDMLRSTSGPMGWGQHAVVRTTIAGVGQGHPGRPEQ